MTDGRFVGASGSDWQFDTGCSPGQWCEHGTAVPAAVTSDHHPAPGYAFEQDGSLTWNPPTPSTGDENNFHVRYVGTSTQAQDYRFRYVVDGAVMPFSNMHYNASKPAMVRTSPCTSLFADDFEPYPVGTFPSSGGWVLVYNGAGDAYQYVDGTYSVSGTKSLHLQGIPCWAATSYHSIVSIPTRVVVKANVRVAPGLGGSCVPEVVGAWVSLYAVPVTADLLASSHPVLAANVDILNVTGMPTGVSLGTTGAGSVTWFDDPKVVQP